MIKNRKLNPRQERFAQAYVQHGNARKAYRQAGYNAREPDKPTGTASIDACASDLLKLPKVESRIIALQARARSRHDYTVDTILDELDETRDLAFATSQ